MESASQRSSNPLVRSILDRPALAIAIVACVISVAGLIILFSRGGVGFDFGVYWRTATAPAVEAYPASGAVPFPYPPTMLMWVEPLAALPFWPAYAGWVVISLAAFLSASRPYLDNRTLALALISPAIVHCLFMGQVSAVLAALLLYSFGTPHRWRAGLALALIASVKPQMILMAPIYLMVTRDWRTLGWAAAGTLLLVALSCALFGLSSWVNWFVSIASFRDVVVNSSILSLAITPAGAAEHWGLPPIPFLVAGTALGLWLVTTTKAGDPLSATAIVATGSFLSAPYAMVYDLSPIVPFLVREIMRGAKTASLALGLASGPLPLPLTVFCLRRPLADCRNRETKI